jgi:hypothetical protein
MKNLLWESLMVGRIDGDYSMILPAHKVQTANFGLA